MSERFFISEVNPNDQIGGGGCVCSEIKCRDCVGPFAVFPHTETDNNLSPHVVLGLGCAKAFVEHAKNPREILSAGEKDPVAVEPEVL